MAYRFSKCGSEEKPDNEITQLLEKAQRKEPLSREEKDRVAELLYGLFGAQGSVYKTAGWAWNMACLPRILVRYDWGSEFHPHYAPDKTSLRRALPTRSSIVEMIYA